MILSAVSIFPYQIGQLVGIKIKVKKKQKKTENKVFSRKKRPASVAHLDARPTGDQEGSTPAKVGNILSWRLIMK